MGDLREADFMDNRLPELLQAPHLADLSGVDKSNGIRLGDLCDIFTMKLRCGHTCWEKKQV